MPDSSILTPDTSFGWQVVAPPVTVFAKTNEVSKTFGQYAPINTIYHVSFEFPDGARRSFPVDVSLYNSIMEKETGILTYKVHGETYFFIGFQRQ